MPHLLSGVFEDVEALTGYVGHGSPPVVTRPLSEMPRSGVVAQEQQSSAIVVLEPVVKSAPVRPRVVDVFPPSIIPAFIEAPTAVLVGYKEKGGKDMPWTNGPASLLPLVPVIGSLLFYVGGAVAIAIGLGGGGAELMGQVKRSYHRRGVSMRVHTGIGRAGDVGSAAPWDGADLPVPYNGPTPGGAAAPPTSPPAPNGHEPGWLGAPGVHGAWGPFLGQTGLPPGPSLHEMGEFFEWVAPWAIEFGSWLF